MLSADGYVRRVDRSSEPSGLELTHDAAVGTAAGGGVIAAGGGVIAAGVARCGLHRDVQLCLGRRLRRWRTRRGICILQPRHGLYRLWASSDAAAAADAAAGAGVTSTGAGKHHSALRSPADVRLRDQRIAD